MLGFAPDAIVVDDEEEWETPPAQEADGAHQPVDPAALEVRELAAFMVSRAHELKIVNTVCPVTIRRQQDTLDTAGEVDMMVVVGGRSSANTKELTRLCEIAGTAAIQIESVRDLTDAAPFEGARIVGVTGGTSTPIEDLRDVTERILEMAGTPEARARGRRTGTRRARTGRNAGGSHHVAPDPARADRRRRLTRGERRRRRDPGRRHRRPAERRQDHALQPVPRPALGHRRRPRAHDS